MHAGGIRTPRPLAVYGSPDLAELASLPSTFQAGNHVALLQDVNRSIVNLNDIEYFPSEPSQAFVERLVHPVRQFRLGNLI